MKQLKPVKTGVARNFDLSVKTENKNVARRFSGWLEIPRDGNYTFSVASSGGSQLFLGLPRIQLLGATELPAPRHFAPGEIWPTDLKSSWAETEGQVTFVNRKGLAGLQMGLSAETRRLRVDIADGAGILPETLLGSRV